MSIVDLKNFDKAVIKSLDVCMKQKRKLLHLGLIPGVEIKIIENNQKGPIVIEVFESKVIIGRGVASKVIVK